MVKPNTTLTGLTAVSAKEFRDHLAEFTRLQRERTGQPSMFNCVRETFNNTRLEFYYSSFDIGKQFPIAVIRQAGKSRTFLIDPSLPLAI